VIAGLLAAALAIACVSSAAAASATPRIGAPTGGEGERPARPSLPPVVLAVVCGAAGATLGVAVAGIPGLLILGVAAAVAPIATGRRRRAKRLARLDEQLVDLVAALASAVRSGRSLEQALALAAEELEPPLAPTVVAIVDRIALGEPFDDGLDAWGRAIGTAEARLVVGVLRLHRSSGGSLSGPLDDLGRTLRSRREGERELRSLTAQARLSAGILGLLPVGFFLFLSVVSRRDIEDAIRSPAGLGAIGVGVALQGAAFVWIRSLLRVEA